MSATESNSIPSTQRAALVTSFGSPYELRLDHPVPHPEDLLPGECLIKLTHAGVCHSDLHVRNGDWTKDSPLPLIGGHEGIGTVVAIGKGTVGSPVHIGDRVGTKWIATVCLKCEMCRQGHESSCLTSFQKVHGHRIDGSFAEYIRSFTDYVTPIPDTLSSEEATPLLCAGVTVHKAIKQTNAKLGQWIAISGAGGGLGHLGVQFAAAMGLRVCAIDTGDAKETLVKKLGAEAWVDFKKSENLVEDVKKACGGAGPVAAVISVGNPKPFEQAVGYLGFKGVLVALGMPGGQAILPIPITFLIVKSLTILGSAIGNRQDVAEALDIAAQGKVKCHLSVKPLESVNEVMEDLIHEKIAGRVVLKI